MAVRWSRVASPAALMPALAVTLTAFVGANVWSVYRSFITSRCFPDYGFIGRKRYGRLISDDAWTVSLKNTVILGAGSPVGDRQRWRGDRVRPWRFRPIRPPGRIRSAGTAWRSFDVRFLGSAPRRPPLLTSRQCPV
jgi:hypothetical protein